MSCDEFVEDDRSKIFASDLRIKIDSVWHERKAFSCLILLARLSLTKSAQSRDMKLGLANCESITI